MCTVWHVDKYKITFKLNIKVSKYFSLTINEKFALLITSKIRFSY